MTSFWYRAFGAEEWEFKPESCGLKDILVENKLCGNSMFHKSAWEKVGGYYESFRNGYEDWEFWIAILARGYRAHIIQEILFNYRVRSDSRDKQSASVDVRNASMKRIIEKHEDLFREHAVSVLIGKEQLMSSTLEYQRNLLQAQEWYKSRDREHRKYIHDLLEAKEWFLQQLENHKAAVAQQQAEIARLGAEIARLQAELLRE